VPSQTGYVYDGDGRVTRQISYTFATPAWETDTAYGGNETTVSYQDNSTAVPPGGTPETTFTDGRGLTTAIYQYHAGVNADPSDPASDYDQTSYSYTPAQQLATITDAARNTWSYGYDLSGDQVSQSDPDAGTSRSAYDAAGQLMSVTDARGKTISYTYDADGRKTAEYDTTGGAAESSSDEIASWLYDTVQKGQLTSSTSYAAGAAYTEKVLSYNGYGLPAETETVIPSTAQTGALAGSYIQEDSYEITGQLEKYTDLPAGGLPTETVGYSYDNAGEPTSISSAIGSYVSNLSYTELGQPLEYKSGTGSEPVSQMDFYDQETNRLTESETVTGTNAVTVDDMHYAYDDAGDVTSEADTPSGGTADVQCLQYDYLGRLTQAWAQGSAGCAASPSQSAEGGAAPYWESYSYNSIGDLTSEVSTPASGAATTVTASYPAAGSPQPHAVSSQQSSGPSGTTTTTYGYDADGQTTSIAGPSSAQSLSWADDGKLASDTTTGTGAGTTSYIYDADGTLLFQSDPGATTLYLPDEQLVLNTATGTLSGTRYYDLGGVTVAARTSAGQMYYLVGDQQGTDSMAINSATLAVTQRWYDPYGNTVGTPASSWPGTKGFVGGTADPATGLTNLGAREYNPAEGAFVSPDPLLDPSDPQDLNPYAYASDNPTTDEDPSGAMVCDGDVCGSIQYFEAHPNAGDGGGSTTPAPARGTTYPPVVQVSPHVYATANDAQLPKLRQAWSWVVRNYGQPRSASAEFSDWWHACGVSPYHSACTGQFGADLNGMTPNYSIEGAFGAGIKLVLGSGGLIGGYLMPLLGSYGSAKLGRALINSGDVRSPSFDAHHLGRVS
jgi:RHS repeat-associated protein